MERIAVLTSGGDSPGMNAAIRAVVRSGDAFGMEVVGVEDGYEGLRAGRYRPLDPRAVSGILHHGGTLLGTARSRAFQTPEGRAEAAGALHGAGIEGLVVIGGDGSLRGAEALATESDVRIVGIPGTIDNDLHGTDWTLGFDTAVNTALESIDRIRDTASSHHRLFYVEVMGRRSGWLALYAALAGGGTAVLVPEKPTDPADLAERVRRSFALGKRFCLVIVAEGDDAGGAFAVAENVAQFLDVDYRVSTLGHVQRGGSPTARDRVLAALLGDGAVCALVEGANRVMVGQVRREVVRTPFTEAVGTEHRPPSHLLELMDRLSR